LSGRFKPEEVLREHRATAVLVGVDLGNPLWPIDESLAELERLVHTASADVVATATQRLDHPHPRTFIGKGKAEEIADLAEELSADIIVFDDDLSPRQQANVEDLVPKVRVLDRTALILEIFAMHAVSREGKLQVELAQLEYLLPRLRGLWGHLERERLGGGRGARFGAGESQLETDRRLARRRISDLKRELKTVRASRELQRKARADSGVYKVAVVGYTNAGKSTLLNAITDADVLVQDMLFATLDSTTRRLTLPEGREVTLTDTVGFINKLPHGLVEAFKSTLDEVREADLLLHVADASHAQLDSQSVAVHEVLSEIDAANTPKVLVLNQMDKLEEDDAAALRRRHPDAVFMSARTGVGTDELMERISYEAARGSATLTVLIPYTRGDLVQLAHERAHVVSERHTGEGTQLVLQAPQGIADKFAVFSIEAEPAES
jgi:GTP-binding protein HflX